MKRILMLLTLLTLPFPLFGVGVSTLPTALKPITTQDLSSSSLTSSFAGANATFASSLSGQGNFCIVNGGTLAILGSTNTTTCDGSTAATFYVPAANGSSPGSTCLERVKINSAVCLKTISGTSTSGTLYGMFW